MDTNVAPPQNYESHHHKSASILSNLSNSSYEPSELEESLDITDMLTDSNHYPH